MTRLTMNNLYTEDEMDMYHTFFIVRFKRKPEHDKAYFEEWCERLKHNQVGKMDSESIRVWQELNKTYTKEESELLDVSNALWSMSVNIKLMKIAHEKNDSNEFIEHYESSIKSVNKLNEENRKLKDELIKLRQQNIVHKLGEENRELKEELERLTNKNK